MLFVLPKLALRQPPVDYMLKFYKNQRFVRVMRNSPIVNNVRGVAVMEAAFALPIILIFIYVVFELSMISFYMSGIDLANRAVSNAITTDLTGTLTFTDLKNEACKHITRPLRCSDIVLQIVPIGVAPNNAFANQNLRSLTAPNLIRVRAMIPNYLRIASASTLILQQGNHEISVVGIAIPSFSQAQGGLLW